MSLERGAYLAQACDWGLRNDGLQQRGDELLE
jgi:hypothetical protein